VTLLSSIQSVARRVGIGAPSAVVSATDDMTLQLLDLARESAEEIGKAHGWQPLRVLAQFVTVGQMAQAPLPDDYDRMANGQHVWNQSQRLPVRGPASPTEWARLTAFQSASGPYLVYRLIDRRFYLYPVPASGQTITYEYISNQLVMAADGVTTRGNFEQDSDTVRFPESLLIRDLRWRWKAAKGLNYAQEFADYQRAFEREAAADRGPVEVSMATALDGDRLSDETFEGYVSPTEAYSDPGEF
jgi:hypothetical protein